MLDSLNQVDTRPASRGSADGAQIRQGGLICRGLAQKKVTERCVQCVRYLLSLPERRLRAAFFPALELLRLNASYHRCFVHVKTDSITRPAKHRWVNKSVSVGHGAILRKLVDDWIYFPHRIVYLGFCRYLHTYYCMGLWSVV